ncbi:glycoside hydrolase superfamily [Filobasidium floriforme]|uniref:glycoside hydrolase superfamily n=1 Tax=Filobasidium floriforme TaxID=5210 RepID=UPI001E8ED477|nr:glycoside hydrolase superfamily [Filobasidium floriforme]KAH8080879.1 glycoside hydrolase superfamily [Filobasidium floriforme]
MLNIFQRNPVELCSVLLLLAGLGQASPVDLESRQIKPSSGKRNLTLSDTIIYDLDNPKISYPTVTSNHQISVTSSIYIVDGDNTSNKTIAEYKAAGKTVMCYFSAGSFEPFRDDAALFKSDCFCGKGSTYNAKTEKCSSNKNKMDGWDEYWLDLRTPACLTNIKAIQEARMRKFQQKGCDGVDPDNVDSYINSQKYGTTKANQAAYLTWLSQTARGLGLYIDLKNSGDILEDYPQIVEMFDFSVIESCYVWEECDVYKPFLDAKKPQIRVEYGSDFSSCNGLDLSPGVSFAQYDQDSLDTKTINLACSGGAPK